MTSEQPENQIPETVEPVPSPTARSRDDSGSQSDSVFEPSATRLTSTEPTALESDSTVSDSTEPDSAEPAASVSDAADRSSGGNSQVTSHTEGTEKNSQSESGDNKSGDKRSERPARESSGVVRHLCELTVCLAIAVTLFRAFEIEGYMISTGSMAPALLGYHKRVVCPSCEYHFTFGVSFDDSVKEVVAGEDTEPSSMLVNCPNCGQAGIDVSKVPKNQGDQLLVDKRAFYLTDPDRWQMCVFRNPQNPSQVYVKRVAGLPGERIQVVRGDLFINGARQRKSLEIQRAMRLGVFDSAFSPSDDDWSRRWNEPGGTSSWSRRGGSFVHASSEFGLHVLEYRHWLRRGGEHETWVPLDRVPDGFERITRSLITALPFDIANSRERLRFDAETRRLVCRGVLSGDWATRLRLLSIDQDYRDAIDELERRSHEGFVTDVCGYNDPAFDSPINGIVDIMLENQVNITNAKGSLSFELSDGVSDYRCEFDFKRSEIRIMKDAEPSVLRSIHFPEAVEAGNFQFTVSLIDRQLLVAVNDDVLFDPVILEDLPETARPPRRPVRVMVSQTGVELSKLRLYRDVYYTRGKAVNAVEEPYELGDNEFFMLGDNSPVSSDSRSWPDGTVPRKLLVGRPLIVHLPSRPGVIRWEDRSTQFRIPDLSRIRYIR